MAEEKGVAVEVRKEGAGNALLNADPQWMRQALANLLDNAIKPRTKTSGR